MRRSHIHQIIGTMYVRLITRLTTPWALAAMALLGASATAHAYVTPGAVTLAPYIGPAIYPSTATNYVLHFGSRPASLGLNYQSTGLDITFATADADIRLKLVQPGEAVTSDFFLQPGPTTPTGGLSFVGQSSRDFYLAGMVTTGVRDPGEPAWDSLNPTTINRYGWAHFVVNGQGQLTVTDSAIAYVESGIIAGTTQAVPEPGTYGLMGIGLVGLALVRRRLA